MHPAIAYQLNQNHLAELRHQAQRSARARAARQVRRARPPHSSRPGPALAHHALAVLGPRGRSIAPPGASAR